MKTIIYSEDRNITLKNLAELFLSVDWASGEYPGKLFTAVKNYEKVIGAYDNDKLVGLICVMDDGVMTAYIHYLLVNPKYQSYGIGRELIERVKEYYKDYLRLVLVCYDTVVGFYEKVGFKKADGVKAMYLTELRN